MSKSRLFDIGKVVWPYESPGDKSGTHDSFRSLTNLRHFRGFHVQGSTWTAMNSGFPHRVVESSSYSLSLSVLSSA